MVYLFNLTIVKMDIQEKLIFVGKDDNETYFFIHTLSNKSILEELYPEMAGQLYNMMIEEKSINKNEEIIVLHVNPYTTNMCFSHATHITKKNVQKRSFKDELAKIVKHISNMAYDKLKSYSITFDYLFNIEKIEYNEVPKINLFQIYTQFMYPTKNESHTSKIYEVSTIKEINY
jgi:hypothetical protein